MKVDLHNTHHPNHGTITLATDWTDRGDEPAVPDAYTVRIGDYSAFLSGARNVLDRNFEPGRHRIVIHNAAEGVAVNGTTASADYDAGETGWFFTGTNDADIERDKHHEVAVNMRQRVRRLTLELEIEGNARDRIDDVAAAVLSGVAEAVDIENPTGSPIGDPVTVAPAFAKTDYGYAASRRLLGVAGQSQILTLALRIKGANPSTLSVESNLSDRLTDFNANMKTPLTLRGKLTVDLDDSGGEPVFSATVDKWRAGNDGDATAD